jgi:dihydrofolate reductase
MLWHLPNDLKFFKNVTWGMPVVMGRKTFESLGSKPLKGRLNIVLTHEKGREETGVIFLDKWENAQFLISEAGYKETMIIGGAKIYEQFIAKADKVYITRVQARFPDADAFFPAIDEKKFRLKSDEPHPADEKHAYAYNFQLWEKK